MSLTLNSPSWDKVYTLQAWQDNNTCLVVTQGEGVKNTGVVWNSDGTINTSATSASSVSANHAKAPRFQLRDKREVIDLTNCTVIMAMTRPDGSEDLLSCQVIGSATAGTVACPITASSTAIAGKATCEIRVLASNNTIKFYGIHVLIYPGVSDAAAEQSTQFHALIAALQKVGLLTPEGSITLDDVIQENGTDPVASGVIYNALADLTDSISENYMHVDKTMASGANGATDEYTVYYGTDARYDNVAGSSSQVQYRKHVDGSVSYRTKSLSSSSWSDWQLVASQNVKRVSSAPTSDTEGELWDVCWYNDGTYQHCYQCVSLSNGYKWVELPSEQYASDHYMNIVKSMSGTANSSTDIYTVYYGENSKYTNMSGTYGSAQFRYDNDGKIFTRHKSSGASSTWSDWAPAAAQNISRLNAPPTTLTEGELWDTVWYSDGTRQHCYQLVNIDSVNDIYQWIEIPSADVTVAGLNLHNNITKEALLAALQDENTAWHESEYAPSAVSVEYPVPMLWHDTSNDVYYIVYSKEVTSNGCAYSSYQIPKITVGVGSPSSSSVIGHIHVDVAHDSAYICFGGTSWYEVPLISGLYDYVRTALHIDQGTGEGIIPTPDTSGNLFDEWWTIDDSNRYVCYRMVKVDTETSPDTPRYIWKQVISEDRTIAGLDLSADITVEALLAAIQDSNVAWYESEYAPSVTNGELPVPLLWHNTSDDIYYIVYNKEWTSDGWAYSSYQIPKTVIGVSSPSFSGTAGQLYIDISHRTLFMCFGGTTWYEIPVNNGFFDYVRCVMHIDATTGNGISPTATDSGILADEWWTIDADNNYVCYRMVGIDDSGDTPRYIWKQYGAPPKYPKKFAYTINANGWNNGAYTLSAQMVGVADGRHKVDIDINEATFLQLQSDGCHGLYVETDLSGSTPVYTLYAIGNVPSVTITVQMTVSQVISVLE